MTDRNFARALPLVLKHEGGFVDHPKDPGGATNKGVTIKTFRAYVKPGGTVADLKAITNEQVATVYYRQYWSAVNAQALPSGLDYAVFDFAVNSGPARAAEFLQRVLKVPIDRRVGPKTAQAANDSDVSATIIALCNARLAWLKRLKTWPTFGKGWERRVNDVRKHALAMVGKPAMAPAVKETLEQVAATDRISTTEVATGITGIAGTATAVKEAVDATKDTAVSVWSLGPWILLAIVFAGGAFYIWRERRKKRAAARAALAVEGL